MIKKETIEEIQNRVDIVEVISEYVVLKKSGSNFKGLCPFHKEKTPSFIVNPTKQIFHCFGCNIGGNVFSFLMNYKGFSFYEAVKELAYRVGVYIQNLETTDSKQQELKQILKNLHIYAKEFYKWVLNHKEYGEIARNYLKKRNISQDSIEKFELGYSLPNQDSLYRYLSQKGFNDQILESSGLVIKKENTSSYYDRFRNRIIFPIYNEQGDIIAFGGRTLISSQAKYINSPETSIYIKGENLYGLNFAKESIKTQDKVILMEGYLDVITAHEFGFTNVVGSLGTSLTPYQAKLLLKYTPNKKVTICYDSDEAGINATNKAIEVIEEVAKGSDLTIFITEIPISKDPDEYIKLVGKEKFNELILNSKPYVEWQIHQTILKGDKTNPLGKSELIKKLVPIVFKIKDKVYKDECIKLISTQLDVKEDILRFQFKNLIKKNVTKNELNLLMNLHISPCVYKAEQGLIYIMLEEPTYLQQILIQLEDLEFTDNLHKEIKRIILELVENKEIITWQDLLMAIQDPKLHSRITEIMNLNIIIDNVENLIKDYVSCLYKDKELREQKELLKQIEQAQKSNNIALLQQLLSLYNKKLLKTSKYA